MMRKARSKPRCNDAIRGAFDARCFNCKRSFGWVGGLTDRPPCPGCGASMTSEELEEAQGVLRVVFDAAEAK